MTAPIQGSSPRPSTTKVPIPAAAPTTSPAAAAPTSTDALSLLTQIMPVAQLALWEAWDSPLQLIAIHFGQTSQPTLPLEPAQLEPGSAWDENVYPADREKL